MMMFLHGPSAEPGPRERREHALCRLSPFFAADPPRRPRRLERLREVPRAHALGAFCAFLGGERGRGADERGEVGAGEAA